MSIKDEIGELREITAREALERLHAGNEKFLTSDNPIGDVSPETRARTYREGQKPYAVIVTCSDSRVIPESIFSAGIGELFVVRSAGNVIGSHELGSVEYAVSHLGCPLVVVMGHTSCGAVGAAILHEGHGHVRLITDRIREAIGDETDIDRACALNAVQGVADLKFGLEQELENASVIGAVYHMDTGRVEFLSEPEKPVS